MQALGGGVAAVWTETVALAAAALPPALLATTLNVVEVATLPDRVLPGVVVPSTNPPDHAKLVGVPPAAQFTTSETAPPPMGSDAGLAVNVHASGGGVAGGGGRR